MNVDRNSVEIVRGCGSSAAALAAAVRAVSAPYVYVIDGDVAGNEGRLDRFLARAEATRADVVVGTKRSRRWRNRLYFAFVRLALGVPVTDTQTGARLWRTKTLSYALDRALSKTGAFDLELLTIAAGHGARIAEVELPEQLMPEVGAKPSRRFVKATVNDTLAIFYRARLLGYYAKCLVPQPLDHEPLVSIVIACPKASWMLEECLAAIAKQTYRKFEVIVVPDELGECLGDAAGEDAPRYGGEDAHCSSDCLRQLGFASADMRYGGVRYIPSGPVRPAEKRNLAIAAAKGEIIAFIDDDAYPEAHWLEFAVKYFGEPSIGGVGGPGVTPPGDSYLARIGGRVYDNILVSGNYRYRYKAGGVRQDCEDYPSCNLFVRKELLEKIGGYRTDFWPGEDTLLCKDILDNWKRIIYDPWIVVYHHRRPILGAHLRQLGRYGFHRGYFCKRYPSNSLRLSYFIPTLFVAYLFSWGILTAVPEPAAMDAWLYVAWKGYVSVPLLVYLALVILTSAAKNPVTWLLTAVGVVASHITYGIQFFCGLVARKAPCEFIGADHGSAKSGC